MSQKQVHFAVYCNRRLYDVDISFEAVKSYSSADRHIFRAQALREGMRIKHIVSLCPARTGRAIHHLIKHNVLACEELLGIEVMIGEKPVSQIMNERKSHVHLVLTTQEELKKKNGNESTSNTDELAKVAIAKSHGHVEGARLRALLAL